MIVGTGFDLVSIERFRDFTRRRGERGLRRLFSAAELEYCLGRVDPVPSLAVRFAAKEAFFKAVGLGWGAGGSWTEVEVRRDGRGAPRLELHGRAVAVARERGAGRSHLSLSHTASMAGAFVVLELAEGGGLA